MEMKVDQQPENQENLEKMSIPENEQTASNKDIEENKVAAILAYIIFFIPLLIAKESKFAMYHANQGLVLFLTALCVNIVGAVIPMIGWLIIFPIGNLVILILVILGIVNSSKGLMKPLPFIGGIQILK